MIYYRVYTLDRDGRHIDVKDFHAKNDNVAIAKIRAEPSAADRELWALGRMVKRFLRPNGGGTMHSGRPETIDAPEYRYESEQLRIGKL